MTSMDENSAYLQTENVPCITFTLENEDYTLGNSLRSILVTDPQVEFVGCSVPHPTQDEINLRLQTHGEPALSVFKNGLETLSGLCSILLNKYTEALENYNHDNSTSFRIS